MTREQVARLFALHVLGVRVEKLIRCLDALEAGMDRLEWMLIYG